MARDHHQIAEPRQTSDDVLSDPFAKMIVARVARQVGEGQHRDRRVSHRLDLRSSRARRLQAVPCCRRSARPRTPRSVRKCSSSAADPTGATQAGHLACRRPGTRLSQDAAGLGHGLETRRDIDAVAIRDRLVECHVADIEADAKLDRLAVAPNRLVAKFRLDLNGELQRLVGIVEQRENSIACEVGDLAAVVADQARKSWIDRAT